MWMFLAACAGGEPAGCATGFVLGPDGMCYERVEAPDATPTPTASPEEPPPTEGPPDPATVEDVLAALPPCESDGEGDGALDFDQLCAGEVCVGDTFEDLVARLGQPSCFGIEVTYEGGTYAQLECDWSLLGLGASFEDGHFDGVPDGGTFVVQAGLGFEGETANGLGLDDAFSCFLDGGLGEPLDVSFTWHPDLGWMPNRIDFGSIALYDTENNKVPGVGPDGEVDSVYLYGF